jgi:excisionase family DNA binding protein
MAARTARRLSLVNPRKRRDDYSQLDRTNGRPAEERDLPSGFNEDSRLLTVAQFAALSRMSERHIRHMIKAGDIPVLRFGRSIRIRPKDVGI